MSNADLYGEALQLLSECLSRQEDIRLKGLQPLAELPDGGLSPSLNQSSLTSLQEESWVSIEEPVTESTLMETRIALMEVIAASWSSLDSPTPEQVDELHVRSQVLVRDGLTLHFEQLEDQIQHDFSLARANLEATFFEACFRIGRYDVKEYDLQVRELLSRVGKGAVSLKSLTRSRSSPATKL